VSGGPLVIIGDALLDIDIHGTISRVTPDGQAPVVDGDEHRERPGGAGLAALLAAAPGDHEVVLITGLADDEAGERVAAMLDGLVSVVRLPLDGGTPEKARVMTGDTLLVRLDRGRGRVPPGADLPSRARLALADAEAVLVADYGRGMSGHPEISDLLAELAGRIPVAWDPHPRGGRPLPGVRLVTPNEAEALAFAPPSPPGARGARGDRTAAAAGDTSARGDGSAAALGDTSARGDGSAAALGDTSARGDGSAAVLGDTSGRSDGSAAARRAAHLVRAWGVSGVAVTLGDRGAVLATGSRPPVMVPAPQVSAPDTCGAGDSFAVAVTRALAGGLPLADAVSHGVHAASSFVAAGAASSIRARWENAHAR
jgi:bifunctional ADP-heptose synthase (sugar kinase/adenylyltransferase)